MQEKPMPRLANLLEILAVLSMATVIIGAFGRWHFLPDLVSHFRIQATGCLLTTGLLLWPLKRRRWSILSLAFGALLAIPLIPYQSIGGQESSATYRLLTMNIFTSNPRKDLVIDYILEQDPDFILLQETDRAWIESLDEQLAAKWPYSKKIPRSDNFGMAMYSRFAWSKCEVVEFSQEQPTPSISAVFELSDGKPLRLIETHTLPPMNGSNWRSRNVAFENLAAEVRTTVPERTIVAGDLNCTAWSVHFSDLLKNSQLSDSSLGQGLGISWIPIPIKLLGLPIDHVLVGAKIHVVRRRVGPYLGSDHRAVVVDFD